MKRCSSVIVVALVLVLCMMMVMDGVEGITCGELGGTLVSCLGYLTGGEETPTEQCCAGVRTTAGELKTTADRRTVCNCMKEAATRFPLKDSAVVALPGKCNTSFPFKLSLQTNCDTIPFKAVALKKAADGAEV